MSSAPIDLSLLAPQILTHLPILEAHVHTQPVYNERLGHVLTKPNLHPAPSPSPAQVQAQVAVPLPIDPKPVKVKRVQAKNACVSCKKACKACDDFRPCSRCVRFGEGDTCVDSVRQDRRRISGVRRGPYKVPAKKIDPSETRLYHIIDAETGVSLTKSMLVSEATAMNLAEAHPSTPSNGCKLNVLAKLCSAVLDGADEPGAQAANAPAGQVQVNPMYPASRNPQYTAQPHYTRMPHSQSSTGNHIQHFPQYHLPFALPFQPFTPEMLGYPLSELQAMHTQQEMLSPFTGHTMTMQEMQAQFMPHLTPPQSHEGSKLSTPKRPVQVSEMTLHFDQTPKLPFSASTEGGEKTETIELLE